MTAIATASARPVVVCERVIQIHRTRDTEVITLAGVDLVVRPRELVAIVGPSGSGKSSLLALLGGLALPSAGRVEVLGRDLGRLSERQRLRIRADGIGIMAQDPARNLLPDGRVVDNLDFAQRRRGPRRRRHRSRELLALVGLENHLRRPVRALSGGEQQRLALAVALAGEPQLLLADEPSNQLDPAARDLVGGLLRRVRDEQDVTVLAVTHDAELGTMMDRTLAMRDGRLGIEHRTGEELGLVGPDGSIQLPITLAGTFPPGSRVRYVRAPHHVELHPLDGDGAGDGAGDGEDDR